jgi:uncharacterized protein DUF1707
MTETTGRDLIRHELPDPFEPTTTRRDDHGRLARRAGDAERTATCEALAEHFVCGRLSSEELENRLGWAVRAVTEDELHQLIADLPRIGGPPPNPTRTPVGGGQSWPATVVIAVVALIIAVVIAGGMLLVLGAVNPLLFVGACLGGSAAVVAGASAGYLVTRSRRP